VDLNANITDEAGNIISGSVVRWYNETSQIASVQYYGNYPLISQSAGDRNIICNATKSYYTPAQNYVMIKITATANIEWASPANYSEPPYPQPFDVLCRVIYQESGTGIDNYDVNLYYYYTPPFVFINNFTTNLSGYINHTCVT
jgi:hypothetical protein